MADLNYQPKVTIVALSRIVEALQGPFYDLALRMLLTHENAKDATQECLLRFITRLSSFREESHCSAWGVVRRGTLNSGVQRRHKITKPWV